MEQSKDLNISSHVNGCKAINKIEQKIDPIISTDDDDDDDVPLDVDLGDPVMYYPYWKSVDEECSLTIKASELLSYFVNPNKDEFIYHVPGFTDAVRRIHRVIGNAVTEGRYIIGGTGSSQLFNFLLHALSSKVNSGTINKRIPVVCAAPFYGLFGASVESEKSAMYEWKGDAHKFDEEGPYVEVVTCPNNPDGLIRKPVVNRPGEMLIHDLAYYWPQYTPTTAPADYDNMLFTMSKFTGHAGSRVGWAIVKDPEIASMMTTNVFLRTIGCSQEGQLRAIKILEFIADSYEKPPIPMAPTERLVEFGKRVMNERWNKIRAVIKSGNVFNLLEYPAEYCNFLGKVHNATPAFAWLESKNGGDASELMSELKIQARNGAMFGSSEHKKCVRITLVGSDDQFNRLLRRLSSRPPSLDIGVNSISKKLEVDGS